MVLLAYLGRQHGRFGAAATGAALGRLAVPQSLCIRSHPSCAPAATGSDGSHFGLRSAGWNLYQRRRQFDQLARRRPPRLDSRLEHSTIDQVRDLLRPLSADNFGPPATAARIQSRPAPFDQLRHMLRLRRD